MMKSNSSNGPHTHQQWQSPMSMYRVPSAPPLSSKVSNDHVIPSRELWMYVAAVSLADVCPVGQGCTCPDLGCAVWCRACHLTAEVSCFSARSRPEPCSAGASHCLSELCRCAQPLPHVKLSLQQAARAHVQKSAEAGLFNGRAAASQSLEDLVRSCDPFCSIDISRNTSSCMLDIPAAASGQWRAAVSDKSSP